jgi:hypothetical protein
LVERAFDHFDLVSVWRGVCCISVVCMSSCPIIAVRVRIGTPAPAIAVPTYAAQRASGNVGSSFAALNARQ